MSTKQLLQAALSLVKTHGFTRRALSESALLLPGHTQPLSDTAVSSLFGPGNEARKTLIAAWLDAGIDKMKQTPSPTIKLVLNSRLEYNEPVLHLLPEAFALLSSTPYSLVNPAPLMRHAAKVADEACHLARDQSLQLSWYAHRASVGVIYSAVELHQFTSPTTTPAFLDSLLQTSSNIETALGASSEYSSYIARSWAGILKSKGLL